MVLIVRSAGKHCKILMGVFWGQHEYPSCVLSAPKLLLNYSWNRNHSRLLQDWKPKSAAGSAGKSAEKKGTAGGIAGSSAVSLLFHRKWLLSALLPAVPTPVPFFPALFPALPAALLGIWAFSVL